MKNILVLAYAISPYKGSEYAVAWNYVLNMSKDNSLTVIYGTSGNHLGDNDEMSIYLTHNAVPNVEFVHIQPSKITEYLNYLNKVNIFNYSFYWAYKSWHRQVYHELGSLLDLSKFDLIHFVCPIGYREPGYLWRLNIPYVWGPIGGVNNVPWSLFKILSLKGKLRFAVRNIGNYLQLHFHPRLPRCLKNVDLLLSSTSETRDKFLQIYKKESYYIPENCILGKPILNKDKFNQGKFNFIFVGRLDEGKGCILFLKSLVNLKHKEKITVSIVGGGPVQHKLEKFVNDHNLTGIVKFYGQLPRVETIKLIDIAHMHVITSLSEANTTVIWEAMEHGVPTLTLDHCGMHDLVNDDCGIKIPVKNVNQIVSDIQTAIDQLLESPNRFITMAENTITFAERYTWHNRKDILNSLYNDMLLKLNDSKK